MPRLELHLHRLPAKASPGLDVIGRGAGYVHEPLAALLSIAPDRAEHIAPQRHSLAIKTSHGTRRIDRACKLIAPAGFIISLTSGGYCSPNCQTPAYQPHALDYLLTTQRYSWQAVATLDCALPAVY